MHRQNFSLCGKQGKFLIENISHGNYIINVSSLGYASINRQIKMGDGLSGILNFPAQKVGWLDKS
jgi:hypothetical protein